MDGDRLRVAIVSLSHVSDQKKSDIDSSLSIHNKDETFKLVEELSKKLNFTYELVYGALGLNETNGNFSGLLGSLQNQTVDVIASRVAILPRLQQAMDFSIPLGEEVWVTMQRRSPIRQSATALLTPFELEVWLLVALSIVFLAPIMYSINRLHTHLLGKEGRVGFNDYVLFVTVSLLKQNHTLQVKTDSQRLLMATWWIAGLVLTTFYTANLTADLARPVEEKGITHPKDLTLTQNQNLRWLTLRDGALEALARVATDGHFRALAKDLASGRGLAVDSITLIEQKLKAKDAEFIWFGPRDILMDFLVHNYWTKRQANSSDLCPFQVTEDSYLSVQFGMTFAKSSPLTKRFNKALRQIDQAGIASLHQRPKFTGDNPCSSQIGSIGVRPTQTGDLIVLFYLFLVGVACSGAAFLIERYLVIRVCGWRRVQVQPADTHRRYLGSPDSPLVASATIPISLLKRFDSFDDELSHHIDQILGLAIFEDRR